LQQVLGAATELDGDCIDSALFPSAHASGLIAARIKRGAPFDSEVEPLIPVWRGYDCKGVGLNRDD
jgi:hypothetical protein